MKVRGPTPARPADLEQIVADWPAVRQSILASYDDCALAAWFGLEHTREWTTHPQARGIIGHATMAELVRTMREHDSEVIGPEEALQILYEVAAQRDVPADERVRVPAAEFEFLRMAIAKFATDNRVSIRRLLAVEEQFEAPVSYPHPAGGTVQRMLTARPDAVIFQSAHVIRAIDWKFSWRPPTARARVEGDDDELTPEGFFQQRAHALVLFHSFPAAQIVQHREFYPARTEARMAHLERDRDLPRLEEMFAVLLEHFDRSMMSGPPDLAGDLADWRPTPGYHCRYCPKPGACPINAETRRDGAIADEATARQYAAEREQAIATKDHRTDALKAWVAEHGPVPVADSKGARVIGWHETAKSRRFETFAP